MKKICLLILCFGLVACDNGIVGKCLPNNSTVSTTEQDGKVIETKTTVRYICGCFENKESDLPDFGPSKEEFLFEITQTIKDRENIENVGYKYTSGTVVDVVNSAKSKESAEKICDKQCKKFCNKK